MLKLLDLVPGITRSETWYDPRFHVEHVVAHATPPSANNEWRVESPDGSTLAFEFERVSGALTGVMCLTFFGQAAREGKRIFQLGLPIDAGVPICGIDLSTCELLYRGGAMSGQVFQTRMPFSTASPCAGTLQFTFNGRPVRIIEVSDSLTIGIDDLSRFCAAELNDISEAAISEFIRGAPVRFPSADTQG